MLGYRRSPEARIMTIVIHRIASFFFLTESRQRAHKIFILLSFFFFLCLVRLYRTFAIVPFGSTRLDRIFVTVTCGCISTHYCNRHFWFRFQRIFVTVTFGSISPHFCIRHCYDFNALFFRLCSWMGYDAQPRRCAREL